MNPMGEGRGASYRPVFSQLFSVAGHPYLQICLPRPIARLKNGDTNLILLVLRYLDPNFY
jgi:hypothetical protein